MVEQASSRGLVQRDGPPRRAILDHDQPVVRVLRGVFGAIGFVTVIINIFIVATLPGGLNLGNYLSTFTNQVNLFAGAVLVVSALLPRDRLPRWWDGLRGAAAVYLVLTALVFALLLAGLPTAGVIIPWVNFVVHRLMAAVLLLDWLLIPAAYRARWWRPLAWMAFPVLFLAYSLARGAVVGWYPYPFLDPRGPAGYAGLVDSTRTVLLGFLVGTVVIDQLGRLRFRLRLRREAGRSAALGQPD